MCAGAQIENVEKFLHHVNVTMRQKHNHKKLSIVVDRIESYDAVDAPSDECDKVCLQSLVRRSVKGFLNAENGCELAPNRTENKCFFV